MVKGGRPSINGECEGLLFPEIRVAEVVVVGVARTVRTSRALPGVGVDHGNWDTSKKPPSCMRTICAPACSQNIVRFEPS